MVSPLWAMEGLVPVLVAGESEADMTTDEALAYANDGEGLREIEDTCDALDALQAEVLRYQAMRCETCKYGTGNENIDVPSGRFPCDIYEVGKVYRSHWNADQFGCRAWARREP